MKTAKKFDCIKMKDEAQLRRAEQLRGLSPQARLDFYRRAHEALVQRQAELREREDTNGPGGSGFADSAGGPRKGSSAGPDDVIDAEYEVKK